MGELWIALAPLAVVVALGLVGTLVPLAWLLFGALGLFAAGLLVGLPSGVRYHVVLRRALLACGPLPASWYWHPHRYHDALSPRARREVMPWFLLGAFGFALILAGCALGVTALALWLRADGVGALAAR